MKKAQVHLVCIIMLCCVSLVYSQTRRKLAYSFCGTEPVDSSGTTKPGAAPVCNPKPVEVEISDPDEAIVAMITKIVKYAGLPQNFSIGAYNIFNAEAVILDNKRVILYNPEFLRSIKESAGSDWAVTGILAHEVAHHLLGHTVEYKCSSPDLELAADKWAGFVLGKMKAGREDAKSGFSVIAPEVVRPGSTHPKRSQRLAKVEEGWKEAKSLDDIPDRGSTTNESSNATEELRKRMQEKQDIDFDILKGLLDKGADPNVQINKESNITILHILAGKDAEEVKLLLQKGADPNIQERWSEQTPLFYAVIYGNNKALESLILAKANVNVLDSDGNNALSCALKISDSSSYSLRDVNAQTVAILIKAGLDLTFRTKNDSWVESFGHAGRGATLLMLATATRRVDLVQELLNAKKIDVNAQNNDGETALDLAIKAPAVYDLLKKAGGKHSKPR